MRRKCWDACGKVESAVKALPRSGCASDKQAHLGATGAEAAFSCLAALAAAKGFTAAGAGRRRGFRPPPPPSLAANSCSLPPAGGGAAPGLLVVDVPLGPSPLTPEAAAEAAVAVGAAAGAASNGAAANTELLCSDTVAMLGALLLGVPAHHITSINRRHTEICTPASGNRPQLAFPMFVKTSP